MSTTPVRSALWCLAISTTASLGVARGAEYSLNDFGLGGALQTTSAVLPPDQTLSVTYTNVEPYERLSVSASVLPRLTAKFQFTQINSRRYGALSYADDTAYTDKSFGLQYLVASETPTRPAIALSLDDIGGTGLFSSEQIALTKHFGDFAITTGVVWGYGAGEGNITNPLNVLSESYQTRQRDTAGSGGIAELSQAFHGPASVFGSLVYRHPMTGTAFKLEYDPNGYSNDPGNVDGAIKHQSHVNIGLDIPFKSGLTLGLSYQRGNQLGLSFKGSWGHQQPTQLPDIESATDIDGVITSLGKGRIDRSANSVKINTSSPRVSDLVLRDAVVQSKLGVFNELGVYSQALPVAKYRYNNESVSVQRLQSNNFQPEPFTYNLGIQSAPAWGGPEGFMRLTLDAVAKAKVNFTEHTYAALQVNHELWQSEEFNYLDAPADSKLPNVRTDVRKYSEGRKTDLNKAFVGWRKQVAQDVYGQVYGGALETMYTGFGAELLYQPFAKPWAIGVDINHVTKRSPTDNLELEEYSVLTGHLNGYARFGEGQAYQLKAKLGQFLANDVGVNLDFSRRFNNGTTVGMNVSFTDVSSEDFGEGSFHKAFYLKVPHSLYQAQYQPGLQTIGWTPLTRDGGQLLRRPELFSVLEYGLSIQQ